MLNQDNSTIIIFTRQKSHRLDYVLFVIFQIILGHKYIVVTDEKEYLESNLFKVNYSNKPLSEKEVLIPTSRFLYAEQLIRFFPEIKESNGYPAGFFTEKKGSFSFDLLAFIFYLISRYEEYFALPEAFDKHGRFKATASLAYRHNFLHLPLVEIWAFHLSDQITAIFPAFQKKENSFKFIATYDIDVAWAFKNRSWFRNILIRVKHILQRNNLDQLRKIVLNGQQQDPFDSYKHIENQLNLHQEKIIFFFLLGRLSRYDRNVNPKNPALQSLIKELGGNHDIGIHPSYLSNINKQQLKREINQLQKIIGKSIHKSRQHYLKLNFPSTYQALIEQGIQEDYTMGYASQVGFRASTAHAFPWFDLSRNQQTDLWLYPFQIMDGTMKNYLKLDKKESIELGKKLIKTTAEYQGTFILLWHNSSFSSIGNWEGWEEVHDELCKYGISLSKA